MVIWLTLEIATLTQVGASELVAGADYALSSIHNIKEAIPEIWEAEAEQLQQVIQPTSVGTAVRA